jgi:predicted DNA-binding transcriptional regulator AlpA
VEYQPVGKGVPAKKRAIDAAAEEKPVQPILPADDDSLIGRSQLAALLGTTTRTLDQMIGAGKFPRADVRVGVARGLPRWRMGTYRAWVRRQCGIEGIAAPDKNRSG